MEKGKQEDDSTPVPGFYFQLSIQTDGGKNLGDILCFEVSGNATTLNVKEEDKTGKLLAEDMTLDDFTITKPVKSGKNDLEKELVNNMAQRYLNNVADKYLLILTAWDKDKVAKRMWHFQKAFPVKFATTGFNSTGNNFLMDQITFKYEKVEIYF
jgi:T4-like virus tail tube protein gp19